MKYFRQITIFSISYLIISFTYSDTITTSSEAIGVVEISLNKHDPGTLWMIHEWLKSPKQNSLKTFTEKFHPERIYASVYSFPNTEELPFAIIAQTQENLNIPVIQSEISQIMRTSFLGGKTRKSNYNQYILYTGRHVEKDYDTGYFINGKSLILGSELSVVKKSIDIMKEEGNSITNMQEYSEMQKRLPPGNDAIIYFNNTKSSFSNALNKQEKKWGISLLLSAKDISSIIMGIDFVDGDKIKGNIIFKAKNVSSIPEIQDDAGFIGETIRRKFARSKMIYKRKITTNGSYVNLNFEMTGMKPLFKELFEEGLSSLLE